MRGPGPRQKKMLRADRKPGSVPDSLRRGLPEDGHFSEILVAQQLKRPTRKSYTERAPRDRARRSASCSALLRVGFAEPSESPHLLVSSYLTVSPLPRRARRYTFCGTFPSLTAGRRYRPPCPVEPGLSSAANPACGHWTGQPPHQSLATATIWSTRSSSDSTPSPTARPSLRTTHAPRKPPNPSKGSECPGKG